MVGLVEVFWVGVVVAGVVVVVVEAPGSRVGSVVVGDAAPVVVVEAPALLGVARVGVVVVSAVVGAGAGAVPPWVVWSVCVCSSKRMLPPVISRITECGERGGRSRRRWSSGP